MKDIWEEAEQTQNNERLMKLCNYIKNDPASTGSTINYYNLNSKTECRFAVRKSIHDFENKDISDIVQWYNKYLVIIKNYL